MEALSKGRRPLLFFASSVFALACIILPATLFAQSVLLERAVSTVTSDTLAIPHRETLRLERFLRHTFPTRSLQLVAHKDSRPLLRKVRYDVIKFRGRKYLLAGFIAGWDVFAHEIAIYRVGADGPIRLWRTKSWLANYYGLSFKTVDAGSRFLLLLQEGGTDPVQFSLSGVLSFRETEEGARVYDLTPQLPLLRARAAFPSRVLLGRSVQFERPVGGEIVLAASDAEYVVNESALSQTNRWRFNRRRVRFELIENKHSTGAATLTTRNLD